MQDGARRNLAVGHGAFAFPGLEGYGSQSAAESADSVGRGQAGYPVRCVLGYGASVFLGGVYSGFRLAEFHLERYFVRYAAGPVDDVVAARRAVVGDSGAGLREEEFRAVLAERRTVEMEWTAAGAPEVIPIHAEGWGRRQRHGQNGAEQGHWAELRFRRW